MGFHLEMLGRIHRHFARVRRSQETSRLDDGFEYTSIATLLERITYPPPPSRHSSFVRDNSNLLARAPCVTPWFVPYLLPADDFRVTQRPYRLLTKR